MHNAKRHVRTDELFCYALERYLAVQISKDRDPVWISARKLCRNCTHDVITAFARRLLDLLGDEYKYSAKGTYAVPLSKAVEMYMQIELLCSQFFRRRIRGRMELVSVRMSKGMLDDLDRTAAKLGKTRSEVIRDALRLLIIRYKAPSEQFTEVSLLQGYVRG